MGSWTSHLNWPNSSFSFTLPLSCSVSKCFEFLNPQAHFLSEFVKSDSSQCGFMSAEWVVEKLSCKLTYEVTPIPDPLLCLAVVHVCHEKALLIPTGSILRRIFDAVHSYVWLPHKYFSILVCALSYTYIMTLWFIVGSCVEGVSFRVNNKAL